MMKLPAVIPLTSGSILLSDVWFGLCVYETEANAMLSIPYNYIV